MSKSYHNAIFLSDTPDDISARVAMMITDPQRIRRSDPGNPDICNVFEFHKIYSDAETVAMVNADCRTARIGCVECKQLMAKGLIHALAPIREKNRYYTDHPEQVDAVIAAGREKAGRVAGETMDQVRAAVRLDR
jgi:tryptophanyl-tRNA synthetase